ncbi:hypothetical protein SAMN04488527_107106 [Aliiroseovarius crassostreae]|uniref:Uncharacterized protein n=3 Tax=Aliiroseovarius crassostreae TaxID=154981 RepID=A0A0P7KLZ7_9RHOB|nr:hypothetical protein AKJ29_10410 [Aliiroseovarius crassostreae]SFU59695.1 hypothetical protein SAMN04488527_107106 [Aliiroseovarius crassostreae]
MLKFLKRSSQKTDPAPAKPPSAPQMPTPLLTAEMMHRLIRNLAREGHFQGSFAIFPDYLSEKTGKDQENVTHASFLAGGHLDPTRVAISFAGITGPHLASLAIDVVMDDLFELIPKWHNSDEGTVSTRLPFGPPGHWMLIDCVTEPVDPWSTGQICDGSTLRISLVEEG